MSTHSTPELTDLATPDARADRVRGGEDLSELKESSAVAFQALAEQEQRTLATLSSVVKATSTTTTSMVRSLV